MMASGKTAKKQRRSVPVMTQREGLPWLTIAAVGVVVALIAVIFVVVYGTKRDNDRIKEILTAYQPTDANHDPSTTIDGIYVGNADTYKVGLHVSAPQRVAYDRYPPVGGPHDAEWAACNGVVYSTAVRTENMVHTLEHGAIWITYNPDTVGNDNLDTLQTLVQGKSYITLSPYPGLDSKISLQAWAHQLKVDSASDDRIREFITALQRNPYLTPEVNGTCSQPDFSTDDPPAFVAEAPGADAVQLDGSGGTSGAVVTASTETQPMDESSADVTGTVSETASATASGTAGESPAPDSSAPESSAPESGVATTAASAQTTSAASTTG